MSDLSLANAAILGVIIESMLYGFLTCLFYQALRDLIQRRRTKAVNKILVGSACLLWALATVHVFIVIARCVTGFIQYADADGGAAYYLGQMGTPLFIAMQCIFVSINAVTDSLMVYRTWIMWDERWYIIVPSLCSMGGALISAVVSIYYQGKLQLGQTFASIPIIVRSADFLFGFALFTNLTTTCLIAGRIMYLMREGRQMHNRTYISIVGIIVESGALMAATQCVELGLWAVQDILIWTFVDILAQIMAISPMLIIVRASSNSPSNQTDPVLSIISAVPKFRRQGPEGNTVTTTFLEKTAPGPVRLTDVIHIRSLVDDELNGALNNSVSHLSSPPESSKPESTLADEEKYSDHSDGSASSATNVKTENESTVTE